MPVAPSPLWLHPLLESVKALALCHKVSPIREEGEEQPSKPLPLGEEGEEEESEEEVLFQQEESSHGVQGISYQASSPDEVNYTVFIAVISILTQYSHSILRLHW